MIACDNNKCEHNKKYVCLLDDISIVDDSCISRRKKQPEENYARLMKHSPIDYKKCGK